MKDESTAPIDEEIRAGLIRFFEQEIPFNAFLGMRVEELSRGHGKVRVPHRPEYLGDTQRPALHGGVISTLLDTAGGLAAFTEVEPGDRISTVDLRVDYLRPAAEADLIAEAWVIRVGNRVAVCDVIAYQDDRAIHIATGKSVYNIRRREE